MDPDSRFIDGMLLGLICSLVGALVTFVVMAFRKPESDGGHEPPEEGNPFVEPLPSAPDRIPDWVLEEE